MTSQGSALTRFRRALEAGNPLVARAAAAELSRVELHDALALCLLHRQAEPARYERMAVRWHSRFCSELGGVTLEDSQLLLAALHALAPESPAASTVADLCERYGLGSAARLLASWQ